jgi:hypothetical protein
VDQAPAREHRLDDGPGLLRRWHYHPSKSYDNSNTQYAMLGSTPRSSAASTVGAQVWIAAANHWLTSASKTKGETFPLQLESAAEAGRTQRTVTRMNVPIVGWGYSRGSAPTGSMTCAGITGLSICVAALRLMKKGDQKQLDEIEAAVLGGYAWLAKHFTVRGNPPGLGVLDELALTTTCTASSGAASSARSRGCRSATGTSRARSSSWRSSRWTGAFGSIQDTCFAILFLKKAALPAITPGR